MWNCEHNNPSSLLGTKLSRATVRPWLQSIKKCGNSIPTSCHSPDRSSLDPPLALGADWCQFSETGVSGTRVVKRADTSRQVTCGQSRLTASNWVCTNIRLHFMMLPDETRNEKQCRHCYRNATNLEVKVRCCLSMSGIGTAHCLAVTGVWWSSVRGANVAVLDSKTFTRRVCTSKIHCGCVSLLYALLTPRECPRRV
jgi:hypothetical protein